MFLTNIVMALFAKETKSEVPESAIKVTQTVFGGDTLIGLLEATSRNSKFQVPKPVERLSRPITGEEVLNSQNTDGSTILVATKDDADNCRPFEITGDPNVRVTWDQKRNPDGGFSEQK
eukprot:NODE_254_length_12812_cov_0.286872.p8 type:complete len:119 gc:universal NODE_254_length_12812_cov_0.286872:5908-6264(+)